MGMLIKVRGGTSRGEDLCQTCVNRDVLETEHGETLFCLARRQRITEKVLRCSFFTRLYTPLAAMMDLAWLISTDKKGEVGFRPYREMDAKEKFEQTLEVTKGTEKLL